MKSQQWCSRLRLGLRRAPSAGLERRPSRWGRRWLSYVLHRVSTCLIYADANEGPIPSIPVIRSPSVPLIAMIVVYIIPLRARAGFDRAHGACMGLNGNTRPRRRRRQRGEEASRVMHEVAGGGATPRSCIWLLQPPPVSSVCTYSRRVNRSCAREAFDLLLRYERYLKHPFFPRLCTAHRRSIATASRNHVSASATHGNK